MNVSTPSSDDRRLRVVTGSNSDGAQVATLLDAATIRVDLPVGTVHRRHQLLVLTLVDLLGRLFPRIDVRCDTSIASDAGLPPGPNALFDRLTSAARNGGLTPLTPNSSATITVHVGTVPDLTDSGLHIVADGGDWVSYNGTEPTQLPADGWGGAIPIGPLLSACRAAGQVTHLVLSEATNTASVPASVYADALRHVADSVPVDTETPTHVAPVLNAVLVGAGSVGGAAVFALSHVPSLTGSLIVTDPQRLEAKNLDRALLATSTVASAEELKADVAATALTHLPDFHVTPWPHTLEEWVASQPADEALPLVLAAVDSREARRSIQDCLPLELINAACNPTEVHISGHRTGDGPCVCCLHMAEVLDATRIRIRVLAADTGLNERFVREYLVNDQPMDAQMVRFIEQHRGLANGALASYGGKTFEQLRVGALLYGATPVNTGGGTVAVAAPYITALAGVLLAAEALKDAGPEFAVYRLGPRGPATKYAENPLAGASQAMLTNPSRWPTHECLCRSTRRLRLMALKYDLDQS